VQAEEEDWEAKVEGGHAEQAVEPSEEK